MKKHPTKAKCWLCHILAACFINRNISLLRGYLVVIQQVFVVHPYIKRVYQGKNKQTTTTKKKLPFLISGVSFSCELIVPFHPVVWTHLNSSQNIICSSKIYSNGSISLSTCNQSGYGSVGSLKCSNTKTKKKELSRSPYLETRQRMYTSKGTSPGNGN